jgi:putative membrane protein
MRLIKAVIALLFVAVGVLFGALNRTPVSIDLGFTTIEQANLGTSLLAAVLAGAIVAGLVLTAAVVWPLRRQLRRAPLAIEPATPEHHE